jgi:hypothetical protein
MTLNLNSEDLKAVRGIVNEAVDEKLEVKFGKFEKKIDEKFERFEKKLEKKFEGKLEKFETTFEEKFDKKLEEKFRKFEETFEQKLDKKLEEKFEPIREAMKVLLKTQIKIVDRLDTLESLVKLLVNHTNLSEENREITKKLKALH